MDARQLSFLDILTEAFIDPAIMALCRKSSKERIARGIVSRAFDDFPELVTLSELENITRQFHDIFTKINNARIPSEGLPELNQTDKDNLRQFESAIAKKALKELLNSDGKVKKELEVLLEWENCINRIDNSSLICAFVGALNHLAILRLATQIELEREKFTAVCDFVNSNYRNWVQAVMIEADCRIDPLPAKNRDNDILYKILTFPKEHKEITIALGLGGSLLIAGIAIGALLFKSSPGSISTDGALTFQPPPHGPHF